MDWYVVVRGKPYRGTIEGNLSEAGVGFYIPVVTVAKFENDRMVGEEKSVMSNLVFIQTERPITKVIESVDGLRYPYYDHLKCAPAVVPDGDLQRFRRVLAAKSAGAVFLEDPFIRFANHPKVRVVAGDFEGLEGVIVRIRRDRKVVVSLGDMAVAVSGIHPSLLQTV